MAGQPQQVGFWTFDVTTVEAIETGGISPNIIVNAGDTFDLRVSVALEGFGASSGEAPWYDPGPPVVEGAMIEHFALNMQSGVVTHLPYRVPTGQPSLVTGTYQVTTGPYTTGPGQDLELGTYQITTCIRLTPTNLDQIEAAFCTSNLMVIVAA